MHKATSRTEEEIRDHVEQGNYHAGINIAISAVNACRRNGDQPGTDHYLEIIRQAVMKMSREFGSTEYREKIGQ